VWGHRDVLPILAQTYYSVDGGFIRRDGEPLAAPPRVSPPMGYSAAKELLALCETHGVDFCDVARTNEESIHGPERLDAGLDAIWDAMAGCVQAGLHAEGTLPGGLGVKRRAAAIACQLQDQDRRSGHHHDTTTEWLQAFALAVNEENASGGRVVTAPTNGGRGHPRGRAVLPAIRARSQCRGDPALPAHRDRDRFAGQGQRVDLRR